MEKESLKVTSTIVAWVTGRVEDVPPTEII